MIKGTYQSCAIVIVLFALSGSDKDLFAQRRVSSHKSSQSSTKSPTKTEPEAAPTAVPKNGVLAGKRINFVDGTSMDVDDAWKQGDSVWYRRNGTSQSLDRPVRQIEDRYTEPVAVARTPDAATKIAQPPAPAPVATWIYLVDGARFQVDDVREVADGAWYNRGKVTNFIDRLRIARIEREKPGSTTAAEWKQRGWSSGNLAIDSFIKQSAGRFGVDPYLVFLVIEQESQFHPRALSPKGARGLMQLMPGTARRFGVARPFDPGDNIRGGTQYLKELLTMFGGKVDLALASYNAGEGRVIDYGNRVPPFRETRDYVKRISSRYRSNQAPETPDAPNKEARRKQ
jgi:soluble lytic murein transglycosylase-like protein